MTIQEYPYVWPKFFLKLLSRFENLIKYFKEKELNNLKDISASIFNLIEKIAEIDGDLDLNYSEYEEKRNKKFIQRMKPMSVKAKEKIKTIDTLLNNLKTNLSKEKNMSKEEKTKITQSIDTFKRDLDKIKSLFKSRDRFIGQEIKARAS